MRISVATRSLDEALYRYQTPEVSQVANSSRPAMTAVVTSVLRWPDRVQASGYVSGFPVVDAVQYSGVFREVPRKTDLLSSDDLLGDYSRGVISDILASTPQFQYIQELYDSAVKEANDGFASPLMSKEQMDVRFGEGQWLPLMRFMVDQGDKLRPIDDAKRFQLNKATHTDETIFTTTIDSIPVDILCIMTAVFSVWGESALDWLEFVIGLDDLLDAYRYVPVLPTHLRFSISSVYNPAQRVWNFFIMYGHPFGLEAAVLNFNRRPTLVTAVSRRITACATSAFFDDFRVLDLLCYYGGGQRSLQVVMQILGVKPSPAKHVPAGFRRQYLGQSVDLSLSTTEGTVTFAPKDGLPEKLDNLLDNIECTGTLPKSVASRCHGLFGWSATTTHGKCGRIGLNVFRNRQWAPTRLPLSYMERINLRFLRHMLHLAPPKTVNLFGQRSKQRRVWSDASWEPSRPPRLGWLLQDTESNETLGGTALVDKDILAKLVPRKTQIVVCEAIVVPQVMAAYPAFFENAQVVWFVDNEAACSSLVRGASRHGDIAVLAALAHLAALRYSCQLWFEWIDSDSNPSDGLSRLGINDAWTLAQGWRLRELEPLTWSELSAVAGDTLGSFLDIGVFSSDIDIGESE